MNSQDYQYYWWTNAARTEMAALITQMGLDKCPVCDGQSLYVVPWPAVVEVGGFGGKPVGDPHRGNALFMVLVRCESCGHSMMFDSEKLTGKQPPLWGGPGPPTD